MPDKPVTTFGDDHYRQIIEQAKKNAPPVGGAPMPSIPGGPSRPAPDPEPVSTRTAPDGQPFINPPRPPGAGLSLETREGLKALEEATRLAAQSSSSAGSDADLDAEADALKKETDEVDAQFDYDEFGNRLHSLLQNKPRREAIEKRCEPLNLDDLLVHQELRQRVPIIPGRYEPTYRSPSGAEELWVKRRMSKERGSEAYLRDQYALMSLALGLFSINGRPLSDHLDKDREVDEALFLAKFRQITRYPFDLLADLSVNFTWFGTRVKKLLVVDKIKGF